MAAIILLTGIKGSNEGGPQRQRAREGYIQKHTRRKKEGDKWKKVALSFPLRSQLTKVRSHSRFSGRSKKLLLERQLGYSAVGASLSCETDNIQYFSCVIPPDVIQGSSDVTTMLT